MIVTPLAMVQLDIRTVLAAVVQAAQAKVPMGAFGAIYCWNPNTGSYQSAATAPTITVGQEAGVDAEGLNTGAYTQNMYMQFQVTDPDGLVGPLTGAVKAVVAGAKTDWSARWTCGKVGNYSVTIYLYGEVVA